MVYESIKAQADKAPTDRAPTDPVRVQIDLPKQRVDVIDSWAKEAGMTRKEVFTNALALMSWAITQVQSGRQVVSVDDAQRRMIELHTPFLDALKPR